MSLNTNLQFTENIFRDKEKTTCKIVMKMLLVLAYNLQFTQWQRSEM